MLSDVILDQLLQEAKKENDTLGVIKENIIKIAANGNGGGPGGGGPNPPPGPGPNPPSGSPIKIFDVLRNSLSTLSPLAGNAATASTAVRALGNASGTVLGAFKNIPGPIGQTAQALDLVVKASVALYEYMDEQLKMYQNLNSAGVELSNGIFGFRQSAGSALLSMEQLSKVVTENSDSFASMNGLYGDGIQHFGELVNAITLAQKQIGTYGLSQQQIADITAKNYKVQKLFATDAAFRDMNEQQSSQKYIQSMVQMSKVLGVGIDQIMKKNEDFAKSFRSFNLTNSLKNFLPEKQAEDVSKTFGALTSSLGEGGKVIQDVMQEFAVTGKLPQDIGQYGQALIPYFDQLKHMMESGVTDPKEYQSILKRISEDTVTMRQIAQDSDSAQKVGNYAGAQMLMSITNMSKFMNEQAKNVPGAFETLQTTLENWIGNSIVGPFNKFVGETANSISQFLLDSYNETGSIWETALNAFSTGTGKLLGFFWTLPDRLLSYLTGTEFDSSVQNSISEMMGNLFKGFGMIGKTVWDFFFGSKEDVKHDLEIVNKAIFGVIDQIKGLFAKIKNFLSTFTIDGMTNKIKDGASKLGDSISEKWDEVKNGFNNLTGGINSSTKVEPKNNPSSNTNGVQSSNSATQSAKVAKPQVTAKPEIKKAPEIQKPEENKSKEPEKSPIPSQVESDLLNILNKLNNGNAEVVTALTNAVKYLSTISANTEPTNNV